MSNPLRGVLTGSLLRGIGGIRDVGEIVVALADALAAAVVLDDDDRRDLWVHARETAVDPSRARTFLGRLYAPANALWRKPPSGDHLTVLAPANADGPGGSLVMHGDGGKVGDVPERLTDANTVLSPPTGPVLIESRDDDAQLDAPTNGKKVKLGAGGHRAAREGDAVAAGATVAVLPAMNMTQFLAALVVFVNGIAPGTLTLPVDFGVIDHGSDKIDME